MKPTTRYVIAGVLVACALAMFVGPRASSSPDGLEKVAEEEGFAEAAEDPALADSPLADYGVEGVDHEGLGTAVSGIIGILLTLGVGLALFTAIGGDHNDRRDRSQGVPANSAG